MGTILPRRFEPIRVLRKGGASSTFVATDQQLGRNEVIVKVIGKGKVDPDAANLMEVLSWYRGLHHPCFSEVLDAGLTEKRDVFYVRNCHPDSELFTASDRDSVKALISAIDFLQSVGRVHGAIKPSNVFATAGRVKVSDPWIGQSWDSGDLRSLEEDIRFSAPEVLEGHVRSLESDLYSLGALLYRFFSGRDPFEASDPEFLKAKYIWAAPRPLSSVSHVSRKIAEIVTHLLGKDPGGRRTAFESLKNELDVDRVPASRGPAIGLGTTLETALKHLQAKPGLRAMVIEGPVGSGKSRLVEELTSRIAFEKQRAVLCPVSSSEPHSDLARRVISLVEEHDIAAGSNSILRLQRFVEMESDPGSKTAHEEINRDLVSLLYAVSRRVRLLLVLEDIDRSSRRLGPLLEELVRHGEDSQLWVAVTTRVGGAPSKIVHSLRDSLKEDLHEVALESLTSSEAKLLSSFLSSDSGHRNRAEQRAGGNPGFLEEFCKSPSSAVPKGVRHALARMVADLPSEARRVAEILSLFDEPTTWNVVAEVSAMPNDDLAKAVRHLQRLSFITRGDLAIRYWDARTILQSKIPRVKRTQLHARCFGCIQAPSYKDTTLADHALRGGLFGKAADLYRQLGNTHFFARDYLQAGRSFLLVSECCSKDSSAIPLGPEDRIKLARCLGAQGYKARAKKILKELLDSTAAEESELLSSIYSTMAWPVIEDSFEEQVRLLKRAIATLPKDSSNTVHRQAALATALISAGKLLAAEEVLVSIQSAKGSSQKHLQILQSIWGNLLVNQSRFAEATRYFSDASGSWVTPGAAETNLAVCVEHLGDIRKAKELQLAALEQAKMGGPLIFLVLCLSNLGAMETKLGNIAAADNYFEESRIRLKALRCEDGGSKPINPFSTFADMAALEILRGQYRNARGFLDALNLQRPGPFPPRDLFLVATTRCDLHLELGQWQVVKDTLAYAVSLPVRGPFFQIDRLLIEERMEESSIGLCDRLQEALQTTEREGTIYQGCKVRLALARHLIALGDPLRADKLASTSRKVSIENGYKPLVAQSLLLIGLSADRNEEKESALKESLEWATELGFAPLVASCAFHLGAHRFERGDYQTAYDYLSKTISITSRLSDDLSGSDRKTFMSRTEYRQARSLFDEASRHRLAGQAGKFEWLDPEKNLFAEVYRLNTAMKAANDLPSAMTSLLQALNETLPHSIAVVTGLKSKLTCHPIRMTVSDDLRKRILSIGALAGNKPYISGNGLNRTKGASIWVPILSLTLAGGIYAEPASGQLSLNERDIEFLTIVATIAGSTFDHLASKTTVPTLGSVVNSYGIVGTSALIRDVCARIEIAASNTATVLIEGESGTGKELVARAVHQQSKRATGPFVPVDCGALPEGLIEAELFGAKKGAYTGALIDRPGLFEAANHGTIFLDEISNLGLAAQSKLLRALQEREIRKIGSTTGKAVDVRLIAATNCNLERLVREGKFRHDLLYRLKVLHISLPPLRDRKDDVPILATAFLDHLNSVNQGKKYFGPHVMERFVRHDYPGNVRELQNAVERAFYTSSKVVISEVEFFYESSSTDDPGKKETEAWFKDLTEGRQDFWSAVHDRYKHRDISRERVVALIDVGLRTTGGSYKTMASMFHIPSDQYHRFMDFLRRSKCLLDFRPYRRASEGSR